jgi:hypothetical protein
MFEEQGRFGSGGFNFLESVVTSVAHIIIIYSVADEATVHVSKQIGVRALRWSVLHKQLWAN